MVWTCYAVKLGISTLLAAAKLGISPPIPTITLSIQHEGLHYSHKHLTHFGKHYLCGKHTCLSLKTSSKKKPNHEPSVQYPCRIPTTFGLEQWQ